jgi:BirA family biotin operon repressor/biotin-[acetyl-CoA-carboxylase] ligase
MARSGAEEGIAITSLTQTAGRGRLDRKWISPRGEGLYLSLILRPEIEPSRSMIITLAAAVAVAETLALDFGVEADIKWPNDVLVRGRKVCGILVESAIEAGRLLYAVLGIGVNLGQREFPEELRQTATSVFIVSGKTIACDDFLSPLLERLGHWYNAAIYAPDRILSRWEELSSSARSCRVRIISGDEEIEAVTRGIAPSGALIIETASGETREIFSGEVSLRR